MNRLSRFLFALLAAYGIYSTHYLWLLRRTGAACDQIVKDHADTQELTGAQRICSAAGVDTTPMLHLIFPQTPRKS